MANFHRTLDRLFQYAYLKPGIPQSEQTSKPTCIMSFSYPVVRPSQPGKNVELMVHDKFFFIPDVTEATACCLCSSSQLRYVSPLSLLSSCTYTRVLIFVTLLLFDLLESC